MILCHYVSLAFLELIRHGLTLLLLLPLWSMLRLNCFPGYSLYKTLPPLRVLFHNSLS